MLSELYRTNPVIVAHRFILAFWLPMAFIRNELSFALTNTQIPGKMCEIANYCYLLCATGWLLLISNRLSFKCKHMRQRVKQIAWRAYSALLLCVFTMQVGGIYWLFAGI
jgi:hypothetical protein